jgi:hypothetical protein
MAGTLSAPSLFFRGSAILARLTGIHVTPPPRKRWSRGPAPGLGIGWVVCVVRVPRAVATAGGVAPIALSKNR